MRKKEVVEEKSASYKNYEKITIMRYVPFAATIPYTYLHVYIYHMYIWVNLLGTVIICPISAGSGTHNEIEVSVLLQERQKRFFLSVIDRRFKQATVLQLLY